MKIQYFADFINENSNIKNSYDKCYSATIEKYDFDTMCRKEGFTEGRDSETSLPTVIAIINSKFKKCGMLDVKHLNQRAYWSTYNIFTKKFTTKSSDFDRIIDNLEDIAVGSDDVLNVHVICSDSTIKAVVTFKKLKFYDEDLYTIDNILIDLCNDINKAVS